MKKRESVKKSKARIEKFRNYKLSQENFEMIADYVDEHGSCEYGMLEYARALKQQGNIEDARYYFKYLLGTNNRRFALCELVLLELNQKNYINCLAYLKLLHEEDENIYELNNFSSVEIYCLKQLGLHIKYDYKELNYKDIMLINYDPHAALCHVRLHEVDFYKKENKLDEFDIKKSHENFFAPSIDVGQLFNDTRLILKSNPKFRCNKDGFHDVFIEKYFVYPNIGDNTRERLNYLKVVSIAETNNIITMFPLGEVEPDYLLHGNSVYDYFECLENVKGKAL